MLDKEFIIRKIDMITGDLEHLRELQGFTINEIARDFLKYSAFSSGEPNPERLQRYLFAIRKVGNTS